jgi:hypothetical protein
MWRRVVLGAVLATIVVTAATVARAEAAQRVASGASVRMFDPTGQIATEVQTGDVIKSSARASREFPFDPHRGVLFFRLKPTGAVKFHVLTRALAKRGARLGRRQKFALAIGDRVVLRADIDYDATPNGLDGRQGVQVVGLSFAKAQELARAIRG